MMENRYETITPRVQALFIDILIFCPISVLDNWVFYQEFSGWVKLIYYALFSSLLFYFYTVLMHGYFGQTVGKMITRIKVLAIDESKLGFRRAFMRDSVFIGIRIIAIVIAAPSILKGARFYQITESLLFGTIVVVWFLAELITMFTNKKCRAIYDYIAGSVVVRQ